MTVHVYSKPGCVQCDATYRQLDRKGVEYSVIDVSKDEAAFGRIVAAGAQSMPFVEVFEGEDLIDSWGGFNPEKISGLVAA